MSSNISKFLYTYFADSHGLDMGTQFGDVNGDGLADIIQVFTSDKYYENIEQRRVYINQNNPLDLIVKTGV